MKAMVKAVVGLVCCLALVKATSPNYVFIVIDDAGYNDVPYNNPEVIAPTIQGLVGLLCYRYALIFGCNCLPTYHIAILAVSRKTNTFPLLRAVCLGTRFSSSRTALKGIMEVCS
eukprot:m.122880 g.122880  ORF g.122880 m.122880 type:complete len:115 (+) comp15662_c0_seq2:1253-1597(+)